MHAVQACAKSNLLPELSVRNGAWNGRRRNGRSRISHILAPIVHIAYEPKAAARNGSDNALLLAGVADYASRGIDPAGQRSVGYRPAIPNCLYKFILGDYSIAMTDEVNQDVEYLRLDV